MFLAMDLRMFNKLYGAETVRLGDRPIANQNFMPDNGLVAPGFLLRIVVPLASQNSDISPIQPLTTNQYRVLP